MPPIVQHPKGYRGGPVLTETEYQRFRHHRGGVIIDHFSDEISFGNFLSGDYTYGGALYDHFGHFMAEMVHRILPARVAGLPKRFIFVSSIGNEAHRSFEALPAFILEAFDFLQLSPLQIFIVRDHVTIERLHLVEQGAQHHGDPAEWYLLELEVFSTARLDSMFGATPRPKRLYVSRSALQLTGGILGEAYIEAWLHDAGFTIFRPENYTFAEQMDYYRKADCIVFTKGSACHGTELLGSGMLKNVILIPKSIKAGFFERVLRPRSERFATAGKPRMVGTMYYHPTTRFQYIHLGVSTVDLNALSSLLDQAGVFTSKFSRWRYAKSALHDLRRYLNQSRNTTGNTLQAAKLISRFGCQIFKL